MTFNDILGRFMKYWWVILLTTLICSFALRGKIEQVNYFASVGVGLNYNNTDFPKDGEASVGYNESLQSLSFFLEERFTAIENQEIIAAKMGATPTYSFENAFYNITNSNAGFVTLSTETKTQEEGDKFIEGVKEAYLQIVQEWNSTRNAQYQIRPQTEFSEAVAIQNTSPQVKLLPALAGLLVGLLATLVLPYKKKI